MKHLPVISLVVMVLVAIGWQRALNRSYDQGKQVAAQRRAATFPVVAVREPDPNPKPNPTVDEETEKRLGPFSLAGNNYTVVLRQKPRVPRSTRETGNTVATMEIRDSGGTVVYKRRFPTQPQDDTFSDAWDVTAHLMTRGAGTGLMLNYSVAAEPSTAPDETTWWQLFGVVDGTLKAFSGPLAVQGDLLDSHLDTLDFRVWAHHSSVVFPMRVDWRQGRLAPEQNCVVIPCELRVISKEPGYREDPTFVGLCPNVEKCETRERVVVKKESRVEVLSSRVPVRWKEGHPSGNFASTDVMDDQGEISVPRGNVWLKVQIDGREGWIHDEEDFTSLGMVFEQ